MSQIATLVVVIVTLYLCEVSPDGRVPERNGNKKETNNAHKTWNPMWIGAVGSHFAGVASLCGSTTHAALVYGSLHAAEDFTGYGVQDDLAINGVNLNGTGTGLGMGLSGTWSATDNWKTDINISRSFPGEPSVRVPSSVVGGSGGPVLRATGNTGLDDNAYREFTSAITAQTRDNWFTEFWLVFNIYNGSDANPGFIGLADAAGNVLVEAGFTGYSSGSNAHFPPFSDQYPGNHPTDDEQKFGIKAFNSLNEPITATTSSTFDAVNNWHNVVLRGLWADDGSVDL